LKLQYDDPLPNFAFKFNLRRYNVDYENKLGQTALMAAIMSGQEAGPDQIFLWNSLEFQFRISERSAFSCNSRKYS